MNTFPIGKLANFINGYAFKPEDWTATGLPIIRIQNLTGTSDAVNYCSGVLPSEYAVKAGDILISWSASLGVYIWEGDDALLNQHIFRVELREGIDKYYFYYAMMSVLDEIKSQVHGATMQHITKDKFEAVAIPLPPFGEQRRIAAILRAADDERRRRRYTQTLSDGLLSEVFVRMFGDPATNPKGWDVNKLGTFIDFLTSGSRGWAEYYCNSGAKFIRVQNLHDHRLDLDDIAFVMPPQSAEVLRTRVQSNDLLLAITGATIGLCAIVPDGIGEAYVSQHVAIIRLGRGLVPIFAASFISHPRGGQIQINDINYGDTKPGLGLDQIRDMSIICPPLHLQQQFADIVAAYEQVRRQQQESARQADHLFDTLLHQAFTGEL